MTTPALIAAYLEVGILSAAGPPPADDRLARLVGEVTAARAALRRAGRLRSIVAEADQALTRVLEGVTR